MGDLFETDRISALAGEDLHSRSNQTLDADIQ